MARACIGLGSNLDGPAGQLRVALARLAAEPDVQLLAQSRFYRSAPLGPPGQPDYCNAACLVQTKLAPEALLDVLLRIEDRAGRRRAGALWDARVLDLDLLLYEGESLATSRLTLPHPELHRRNFVLVPLAEVAPDWIVPEHGMVADLATAITKENLHLWVEH